MRPTHSDIEDRYESEGKMRAAIEQLESSIANKIHKNDADLEAKAKQAKILRSLITAGIFRIDNNVKKSFHALRESSLPVELGTIPEAFFCRRAA